MRQRQQRSRRLSLDGGVTLVVVIAAGVLLGGVSPARADSDEDAPVFAVQNRKFNLKNEFHLGVGVLPINAYTKGITLGAGYTYHFSQLWAWEIVHFAWSFGVDTNLKKELLSDFMVSPTQIPALQYFGSSSVIVKPLYGKLAFTNRSVVHVEAFLALGLGVGVFVNPGTARPGFDVGGGLRFFLNDVFSLRIDLRDLTYIKANGTDSELYLGLAASVTLGGAAR